MAAVLQPASRESLAALTERLDSWTDSASARDLTTTADELFAVARFLDSERSVRRLLADASSPEDARVDLVRRLFGSQLSQPTVDLVSELVRKRWSTARDIVTGAEGLARRAAIAIADRNGSLDEVEDQLFRFGRIVAREPQLASLLGDTARPVEGRVQLLDSVLGDKVYPVTATLLREAVRLPRSRHLDVVAEELAELAAARRDRSVAKVRTPVELSSEQETKLAETLGRMYGRTISLQVELDRSLLGGLVVQVGGEVIDGSVAGRLAAARRSLPS
ncbi:ATP synthase delta chain [Pseudonocardia sp. Ae406_Ps2]|uniref:F0F1 ATP synthase subunit delta n=1 Tax=unclassified Pseudonocardia TaxID=2619320 RepID=UPI00094B2703|nr:MULTISPECIES: F0F1 ATP synthase subunit delta [unclassified Pseudonocardia]OLL97267.1 ATP synthase delta chain [Pseudonocardia sp. Ae331_Ps2]OLM05021.1 ATP synthase delta chain [Pseudonocardia sp. Ae406_Ps2]OLM10165.1 ATP synthase delta chain [Pseudonocardia sp. Ae505_Ps2]OLM26593.1 ATP synthase delta chain [Pseudonocardia sp. Ae706_Ps2]OLM33330.1 ATP synthase delta chain [Pseudonocardia sp. Ae717_Ps2]